MSLVDKEGPSTQSVVAKPSDTQLNGAKYYQGLITSNVKEGSSSQEMLARNLKLAGGVAGFLVILVLGFLASNGLL